MKKFLVGVANVLAFDPKTGDLVFTSKTMIENSIAISTSNTEIRAGQGNSVQYVYYHDGKMELTLKEAQFNLAMVASSIGSTIKTGQNIYSEESVTLAAGGTGSVQNTPLSNVGSSTVYGWVTDKNGNTTKVTFTGKNFTLAGGQTGDQVCVRYYNNSASSKSITVNSNIVPSILRVVLEGQLASDEAGSGILGKVTVEIPRLQLDGAANLSLTSGGVSQTEMKGSALSYTDVVNGCSTSGLYATITETINSANWYDDVFALAIVDDSVDIAVAGTNTLDVRAIPSNGAAFIPPYADLTFSSKDVAKATVGTNTGVITGVATGSTVVTVAITNKNTISAQADVTVA